MPVLLNSAKQHSAITAISTNAPIAPSAMNFPPLPPRIGAAPVFGGGTGTVDVVLNITLNGTAVPGVVTGTLVGEKVQVVCSGKLPGQIDVTVPVKILSGTTCSMNVPVRAGSDGNLRQLAARKSNLVIVARARQ